MKEWTKPELEKALQYIMDNPGTRVTDLKHHMDLDSADAVDLWMELEALGTIVSEKDPSGGPWKLAAVVKP